MCKSIAGSGKKKRGRDIEGDFALYVKKVEDGKKGAVEFKRPVWALKPVDDKDALDKATECDMKLQSFMARRRQKAGQAPVQKAEPRRDSQEHPATVAVSQTFAPKVDLEEDLDEIPFD